MIKLPLDDSSNSPNRGSTAIILQHAIEAKYIHHKKKDEKIDQLLYNETMQHPPWWPAAA